MKRAGDRLTLSRDVIPPAEAMQLARAVEDIETPQRRSLKNDTKLRQKPDDIA
jgi:hypothetical protein